MNDLSREYTLLALFDLATESGFSTKLLQALSEDELGIFQSCMVKIRDAKASNAEAFNYLLSAFRQSLNEQE